MGIDMEIAKVLQRSLTKQGLKFKLNNKVTAAVRSGDSIKVTVEDMKKGKTAEEQKTSVVCKKGFVTLTNNLGLDSVGISTDDRGRVPVNNRFQTSVPK
ncbi:hypothetical protein NP493_4599g00002 [Ridgeia piscesae]|uniref:dihydrolipoyl dehydrogenase n=1 Tax=Ridgeia piscesae TaxID=27915 RepID=A0AAD9IYG6_RIDPI|nr:hypothetical protein NP493_4599g00002 [Ridgeia piscesae]